MKWIKALSVELIKVLYALYLNLSASQRLNPTRKNSPNLNRRHIRRFARRIYIWIKLYYRQPRKHHVRFNQHLMPQKFSLSFCSCAFLFRVPEARMISRILRSPFVSARISVVPSEKLLLVFFKSGHFLLLLNQDSCVGRLWCKIHSDKNASTIPAKFTRNHGYALYSMLTSLESIWCNCLFSFCYLQFKCQVRISLPSDPLIIIDAQACSRDPVYTIVNNRSDSTRYSNYYCHVEVLVPDNVLMPEVKYLCTATFSFSPTQSQDPFIYLMNILKQHLWLGQ